MHQHQARAHWQAAFPLPRAGAHLAGLPGQLSGPVDDLASAAADLIEAQIQARIPALAAQGEAELQSRLPQIIAAAQPALAQAAQDSFGQLVQSQEWQNQTGNVQTAIAQAKSQVQTGFVLTALGAGALATLGAWLVTRR